jgi:hypothetical protein
MDLQQLVTEYLKARDGYKMRRAAELEQMIRELLAKPAIGRTTLSNSCDSKQLVHESGAGESSAIQA